MIDSTSRMRDMARHLRRAADRADREQVEDLAREIKDRASTRQQAAREIEDELD